MRRAENVDEPQPHPCFCVTTVGTWRALPGDWSAGSHLDRRAGHPTSDVGGNLLRRLELTEPRGCRCCDPTAGTSTRCTSPSTATSSITTVAGRAPEPFTRVHKWRALEAPPVAGRALLRDDRGLRLDRGRDGVVDPENQRQHGHKSTHVSETRV